MSNEQTRVDGDYLLAILKKVSISPASAKRIVNNYRGQLRRTRARSESDQEFERRSAELIADKIVARYAKLAAISGGLTGLTGVIPGLGTIFAVATGATADAAACMKFQVDMCLCLAEAFGYDLDEEDARHLAFLVAAGGSLEKLGAEAVGTFASRAGVRMLRQYLKGAALTAVKEFFKRLGIVFTRKALEKALPFGIGCAVGASFNYAFTCYVGSQAKQWFLIDRDLPDDDEVDETSVA